MLVKRTIAVVLAVLMIPALIPAIPGAGEAHAATTIAKVIKDGKTTTYDDFGDLVDDVDDYSKDTFTIEMLTDWNAAGKDMFDKVLHIPKGSKATLNMHGHVFNRNRSWHKGDDCYKGELINVHVDAKLTINGGATEEEKSIKHPTVPVHTSATKDSLATGRETFYGGLLCGGASNDGPGGIYMDSDATLILNDVTIAGCRAHSGAWSSEDMDGGAIQLDGADMKVVMNNSRITGCLASERGGAIYTDYTATLYTTDVLEMNNSSIDHNYATQKGGGVFLNLDNTTMTGGGTTEISYNQAGEAGGGIYVNDEDISILGFILEGNKSKDGGAICTNNTDLKFSNMKIRNNKATVRGGGISINGNKVSMSDCEITGNKATGSGGGGVYLKSDIKEQINVSGKTIIKGNSATAGGDNYYMSDSDPEDNRTNFDLITGSDVHVAYNYTNNKSQIMVTEGKTGDTIKSPDCTRFLTSDNSGYYFSFLSEPSNRKIVMKKGKAPEKQKPETVTAANATPRKVGTVGAGGGKGSDYELIRGYFKHQRTKSATGDENREAAFFYSDGLFYGGDDPQYKYNVHLGTASLAMAFSAMYLSTKAPEVDGNYYYNRHAAGRQFLADIGCNEQYIYVNKSNVNKPETDSIGVIIGSKKLKKADGTETGDILIPVAVRGGGYELEWASNVSLDTAEQMKDRGKEARGFSDAAKQVTDEVNAYLDNYNLRKAYEEGKVKFWVVGYSRAGATANLTSKRLVDQIAKDCKGAKKSQVFGYTCEAPRGGTDDAEVSGNDYTCIHNLINTADLVPYTAPENMGFKRYGVDHYIPGDNAGTISTTTKTVKRGGKNGVTKVTVRRDNKAMRTKGAKENDAESKAYITQRDKMVKQLAMVDSEVVFDDYFHPMYISFPGVDFKETGSYDNTRVEDFVEDLLRFLSEGLEPDNLDHFSQAVCTRDRWQEPWGMNGKFYSTIQEALRDFMVLAMGKPSNEFGTFTDRAMTIKGKIPTIMHSGVTMYSIWTDVIGDWHKLDPASKDKWTTYFWGMLEEVQALDFLTKDEKAKLQNDWPTILGFLLHLVDGDYDLGDSDYHPKDATWMSGKKETLMYIGTLATFAGYIGANHYPEVNLAWARTYDDWYSEENKEYVVAAPKGIDPPSAFVEEDGKAKKLDRKGAGNVANFNGDKTIYLDNDSIRGEAIYYDLYDLDSNGNVGEKISSNQIYQGGIDLSLGTAGERNCRIIAYDMSYGTTSPKETYDIHLNNNRHNVIIEMKDSSGETKQIKSMYEEGQQVMIQTEEPEDRYFVEWRVDVLDADGHTAAGYDNTVSADKLMGKDEKGLPNRLNPTQTFTMPVPDHYFKAGYGLRVHAYYRTRCVAIDNASPAKPVSTSPLEAETQISVITNGTLVQVDCPISWTYSYEKDGETIVVPASGAAFDDTVYTATIRIPQDKDRGLMFLPSSRMSVGYVSCGTGTVKSYTRDDTDGSAVIVIEMPKTADTGTNPRPDQTHSVLTVGALDLNTEMYDESATVEYLIQHGDREIRLTAPNVDDEAFAQWDFRDSGITLAEGYDLTDRVVDVILPENMPESLVVDAQYIPVVRRITVNLDQPVGGERMQTEAREWTAEQPGTLKIKIGNEYEVHPDFVNIEWKPTPIKDSSGEDRADYLISYVAKVSLKPQKNPETGKDYIAVRQAGTEEYMAINAVYYMSPFTVASVNGKAAQCDPNPDRVQYAFPMTKYTLDHIQALSDITDLEYGSGESSIRSQLPDKVDVFTTGGQTLRANVDWAITKDDPEADPRLASVWTATGTVTLPDGVDNPDNIPTTITVKAYVNEADHTAAPTATLASGTFLNDEVTMLTTNEQGGTTYYTTDGSDPSETGNSARKEYDGETIAISRAALTPDEDGVRTMMLRAYTVKDGKLDSAVVSYQYVFSNEIPVPNGESMEYNTLEQVGISASDFYDVVQVTGGSSGRKDENGDAVAKDVGTYQATLALKDANYKWLIPAAEEEGTAETTADNQNVSFEILPLSVKHCKITGIKDKVYNGKPVTQDPTLTFQTHDIDPVVLVKDRDYTLSYENNNRPGNASVIIKGKGNCGGMVQYGFTISEPESETHAVTVIDGDQTTSKKYKEKDTVIITADEPSDKYFQGWKATLLDADGVKVKDDIAETLLQSNKDRVEATFQLPEAGKDKYDEGKTYPELYSLEITAKYGDRIKKIAASPASPEAGQPLQTDAAVVFTAGGISWPAEGDPEIKYPINWTYSCVKDGRTIVVPASETAYDDTVYTANIMIPQEKAKGIIFAPTLNGSTNTGANVTVTRNDADGSARIAIEFAATEDTGLYPRPEDLVKLKIKAVDLNLRTEGYDGTVQEEFYVEKGEQVVLTSSIVEDERFTAWDFRESGIELADPEAEKLTDGTVHVKIPADPAGEELVIAAQYTPVIKDVKVALDAPEADQPLQTEANENTLKVTISNQYEIDPDFVKIIWSPNPPEGDKAEHDTAYTATVTIVPKEYLGGDGVMKQYIKARKVGEATYEPVAAIFFYSEDLNGTINGHESICDREGNSISYTFPKTKGVDPPDDRHKVTVVDADQTREYQYREQETVALSAVEPSDEYFQNWEAALLDENGETIATDIADKLLGDSSGDITAKFWMPVAGKDTYADGQVYPKHYALKLTADYQDKIKTVKTSPDLPVAGETLAADASVAFSNGASKQTYPVSWTYSYEKDGKTIVVPTTGQAYDATQYTATIKIPQDKAAGILFAPKLAGETETGKQITVTRNDADGSATVVIVFAATENTGHHPRPDQIPEPIDPVKLTVKAVDLNIDGDEGTVAAEYYVLPGAEATLTAPDVENERFVKWNFKETGIELVDKQAEKLTDDTIHVKVPDSIEPAAELAIDAQYRPVLSEIKIKLTAPVGGEAMQTLAEADTMQIKISNEYQIDPNFVDITWTPSPLFKDGGEVADYFTTYTANVAIVPQRDAERNLYIMAKGAGDSAYKKYTANFEYAANLTTTVNGEAAVCDRDSNSVSYTFPETNSLGKVKLISAKAKKGKKALVKWHKYAGANGYQIRYSMKKNFKKGVKKVKVNKPNKTKRIIKKKLKAGKRYFVQVRAFKKITDPATGKTRTVYGKWSNKKKFKVKN